MKTRSMTRSQKTLKDSTHVHDCDIKPDIDCCNHKRCLCCVNMYNSPYFSSCVTKRSYKINNKDTQLNCCSMNIIYLITCNNCKIQYVGEAKTKEHYLSNYM